MSVATAEAPACVASEPTVAPTATRTASFTVFSGELDKLLMAFTLANGAAASGMRTTMFFAFWSLSALRITTPAANKSWLDRVFGWLLPCGPKALPLSRLHMGGLGAPMIRWRMHQKGVATLEQQIAAAQALGVQFVVCETSLELLGLRREELLPGIAFGGVTQCLAASAGADMAMIL